MNISQAIGNSNELLCIADFVKRGYNCSIPYGNAAPYDFLVEKDNKFYKIQCKSSRHFSKGEMINKNLIMFDTVRQTTNTKETKRFNYTADEVDYFATNFDNVTYVIPFNECSSTKRLWLNAPPQHNSCLAADYQIDNYFPNCVYISEEYQAFLDQKKEAASLYCQDCGKPITCGKRCLECSHKAQQKAVRPDRNQFKSEIREMSLRDVGRKYGVSDSAIKKWCKAYKLPTTKTEINNISNSDWINL